MQLFTVNSPQRKATIKLDIAIYCELLLSLLHSLLLIIISMISISIIRTGIQASQ